MLKKARHLWDVSSAVGVLPTFGWILLVVALVASSAGLYVGNEWQRGRAALADNARLKTQATADRKAIDELVTAGNRLRQSAVDHAVELGQAERRMGALASALENTLESNRKFTLEQRGELDALLARRPDLRDLDLGADVLRHWNRGNAGAGAAADAAPAAAARPAGQPAHAVPRPAAGAQREGAGPAGQPRPGGSAVRGLRSGQGLAVGSGGRVGDHGVGVVLQRRGRGGARRYGVQRAPREAVTVDARA
jgi:hypothetical protein